MGDLELIDIATVFGGIGLALNLAALAYGYGKLSQKTDDVYRCLRRIEDALTKRIDRTEDRSDDARRIIRPDGHS